MLAVVCVKTTLVSLCKNVSVIASASKEAGHSTVRMGREMARERRYDMQREGETRGWKARAERRARGREHHRTHRLRYILLKKRETCQHRRSIDHKQRSVVRIQIIITYHPISLPSTPLRAFLQSKTVPQQRTEQQQPHQRV